MSSRSPSSAAALKRTFDAYFAGQQDAGFAMTFPDAALRQASGAFEADGAGWDVQFQFGSENGVEHLECFLSHRMTSDTIRRFYEDGRVELIGASAEWDADLDREFYADAKRRGFK